MDNLRSLVVLKERAGKKIDWDKTTYLCFYFHIALEEAEHDEICKKRFMEWYNIFNKNKDKLKSPDHEKVQEPNPKSKVHAIQEKKPESVQLPSSSTVSSTEVQQEVEIETHIDLEGDIDTESLTCDAFSEKLCFYLGLTNIPNITQVCRNWRKNDVLWKHICNRKFHIFGLIPKKLWCELYIDMFNDSNFQHRYFCDSPSFTQEMLMQYLYATWQTCMEPNSDLRQILQSEGVDREPLLSEILVFSVATILKERLTEYENWRRKGRQKPPDEHFRVGREYATIPLTDCLYDLVLTQTLNERQGKLAKLTLVERKLRRLHIHSIRAMMTNKSESPFHNVMAKVLSNYHTRDLLTFTNKIGTSYSYSKEYENKANKELEKNRTNILNSIPSDCHFWSIDNLETAMCWRNMLKSDEK